jgi:hypothetical protein
MGKKQIKLNKGRRDWEPPPGEFDHVIPILVLFVVTYVIMFYLRSGI